MATSSLPQAGFLELPEAARRKALFGVILVHLCVICASNYLVQIPFIVSFPGETLASLFESCFHVPLSTFFSGFDIKTTWGTFSFPLIFISTDLTVRLIGQREARILIGCVMLPALLLSYVISVVFAEGQYQGLSSLLIWNVDVARIAFGSFAAYVLGQLMDIAVFARLRRTGRWWYAPTASTFLGSLLDTFAFFAIAFWHCNDAFMSEFWVSIAWADYAVKLLVGVVMFVPLYGAILNLILRRIQRRLAASVPHA